MKEILHLGSCMLVYLHGNVCLFVYFKNDHLKTFLMTLKLMTVNSNYIPDAEQATVSLILKI